VLFLLDSVGDNCKRFSTDDGQAGRGPRPDDLWLGRSEVHKAVCSIQKEISDYGDTLLHDTVLGRGTGIEKFYLPKWNIDKTASPLETARRSSRHAEHLVPDDLVSTTDLLERLIKEVCATLESLWKKAIATVSNLSFGRKMVQLTDLATYFPLRSHRLRWRRPRPRRERSLPRGATPTLWSLSRHKCQLQGKTLPFAEFSGVPT
jgi:hypothetical protein